MKKYILYILLLISHFATAQRCKVETDKFTGKKSVWNSLTKVGRHKVRGAPLFLEASINKLDNLYFINLQPQFLSIRTIKEGSECLIKFQDSTVLKLIVDETTISEFTDGEAFTQGTQTTIWYNDLSFVLTKKEIEIFRTKRPILVRCAFTDYDIDKKKADVLMKQIECIESNLR